MKAQLKGGPECSVSEAPIAPAQGPAASRAVTQREFEASAFPSAITSLQTLAGVDGVPEILLYSKGFSEVDQTTETEQTPIFGL